MNGLPNYYGQPYSIMDSQSMDGYGQQGGLDAIDPATMGPDVVGQSQSLHEIISQNNAQLMRRRAFQSEYPQNTHDHTRRASMHDFGTSIDTDIANFQFDPNPNDPGNSIPMAMPGLSSTGMQQPPKALDPRRVRSRDDLSLDTRFSQMNTRFGNMSAVSNFSPAMMPNETAALEPSPAYMSQPMDIGMNYDSMSQNANAVTTGAASLAGPVYSASPVAQNFAMPYSPANPDVAINRNVGPHPQNQMSTMSASDIVATSMAQPFAPLQSVGSITTAIPNPLPNTSAPTSTIPPTLHPQRTTSSGQSMDMGAQIQAQSTIHPELNPANSQAVAPNLPIYGPPLPPARYANAYSSSGFDMLGVLMRVATRPKPEINIGPVDLSCAFVVCDIEKYDLPIVYCSEMFERLTGYTKHEILGRNCRFLQAPDGKVQQGVKRKYVDDHSILYLKNQITKRREAQLSLINYRKGGQPFMNLLTMIPIQFDSDNFKFYVGFQVDLVEQPSSVSGRNPDGTYAINYNRSSLPAYALPPTPDPSQAQDMGQTIPRDEVSHVLTTVGRGESELSRRLWDKILLENTDDVVHVLSLKGLFLYLSPACRKILEYDANELVGMALSSVCHPSDIVPVTRELKDASSSAVVNVVYRIRRKHSGYTWFEAHGSLHTEQGKGRKCLILVGRERPVYVLDRAELASEGSLGESELWSKISTSGMFLHVSSTSRIMLDRLPEDLVGTSMQALMRPDSRPAFLNLLELARSGQKGVCKHDLQNRRGQVLHAQTTIYPGDARPGYKPTFLLAQTRLLKMTRATLLNQKSSSSSTAPSPRTDHASVGSGTPMTHASGQTSLNRANTSSSTAMSTGRSFPNANLTVTNPGSYGLSLGNQDEALAAEDNIFDELKTTRSTSWQFELRQMERQNRVLAEELQGLLSRKKKRKRRKGLGQLEKDCANCHTRVTPEWRRGPSGNRDLCNSCGLRWAKQNGRVSPRKYSSASDKGSTSPAFGTQPAATKDDKQIGNQSTTNSGEVSGETTPALLKHHSTGSNNTGNESWRSSLPPKIDEAPDEANVLPT